MNSDNELDDFLQSAAYSEGDDSENLNENELKLKEDLEDFRDMLPPPIPLMPKSFVPSEPIFQSQNIRFMNLSEFASNESLEEIGPITDKSEFPQKFSSEVTFRSLMPNSEIVYLRSEDLINEGFNLNTANLKKVFARRKNREKSGMRVTQNPMLVDELESFYKPKPLENTLVFESRFESGNLAMASKVSETEYNLLLQTDINSKGHTQWFFFSVSNTKAQIPVKFNILNFAKSDSLFNHGMKVSMYSVKKQKNTGTGWFRSGTNIMYYPNGILKEHSLIGKCYYTLTFTHTFEFSNDTIFFAYSVPYFYSSLQKLLDCYEKDQERSKYIHRKVLCRSLGGNNCDYLTITNKGTLEEIRAKRAVLISARVHPGETVGSYMMAGVLSFLTGSDPEADVLRNKFIFKIVPMLNPDGVINGNYRCSLIGADLNRRWKNPQASIHPIIYHYKRLIKTTAANYDIDLICDLHGHSRKKNIFMYGCNFKKSPQTCKLFPYLLSKISPVFSYSYSRFGVQKSKESTLRVALFKELKIPNVYTLEASFCGADMGKYKNYHFTGEVLGEMGADLCKSLLILSQNSSLSRNPTIKKPIPKYSFKKQGKKPEQALNLPINNTYRIENILKEMLAKDDLLFNGEANSSSSGSDSEPSEDNLSYDELKKLVPIFPPKKKPQNSLVKKKTPIIAKNSNFSKPKTVLKKKCSKCGEEELQGHVCKVVEAPPPPVKKKIVGIKTYYNLAGKRVHDQATQTPPGFYNKLLNRRNGSNIMPLTPDSMKAEFSGNEEGSFSDCQGIKLPNFRIHRKDVISNSSGYLELPKKIQPLSNSLKVNMDDPSPSDVLFWDLARKATKVCFIKCAGQLQHDLNSKQERCIRDCTSRYLECREVALSSLKDLARQN